MLKEMLVRDHARLLGLLDKFLSNRSEASLIIFIGNTERHIALENEVIYRLSENKELAKINKKILDDHTDFTKILNAARALDFKSVDWSPQRGFAGLFRHIIDMRMFIFILL